jgi:hypothetical protein
MAGVPSFPQCLTAQTKAGTLYNTYTTAKSVINPEDLVTLPANYDRVGTRFQIKAAGAISNIVTTPGTIVFQVMMGTNASPIVAWSSGNIQLNATAHTLLPFKLELTLRQDSTGNSTNAKFLGLGYLNGIQFTNTAAQTDATNTTGMFPVPATAPAVGTGFDSTTANILDFWAGFSISNAGNGIQLYDYEVLQYIF